MKVAHLDPNAGTAKDLLQRGRELEGEKQFEAADRIYRSMIRKNTAAEQAYHRLMIILRKQKDYKKEIKLIDEAIAAFRKDPVKAKGAAQSRIHKLSLSLGKSTGLIDKKGNSTYDPEPIAGWKTRKELLIKRIKKQAK